MEKPTLKRGDILYPELSYVIVGCAFEVFNELGPGHAEKTYQNALALLFKNKAIQFNDQVYFSVKFKDKIVGRSILDFLVDGKIIVENESPRCRASRYLDGVCFANVFILLILPRSRASRNSFD